jgi:anhydro-N-acetylmuramic acid kinase
LPGPEPYSTSTVPDASRPLPETDPLDQLRHALGFMTGTSIDGIDAAMIEVTGHGAAMSVRLLRQVHEPIGDLAGPLREFARGGRLTAVEVASLARRLGERHASVFEAHFATEPLDIVVVHGQTVCHAPPDSLQLMNPWPLAAITPCPVLYDLRGADLADGGQGAPITPLADAILYQDQRDPDTTLAIINLGGFINATLLPRVKTEADVFDGLAGFDCCPCNHLLDAAAIATIDRPFDQGGEIAARGTPDASAASAFGRKIAALFQDGRSGGDGDEHREDAVAIARAARSPADGLATICQAIGIALADCITGIGGIADIADIACTNKKSGTDRPLRLILAGGGVLNACLVGAIRAAFPPSTEIRTSDELGIPAQARESAGMATLGALSLDGVSITAPSITGRRTGRRSGPAIAETRTCS